ncbi:MAG: putative DNA binding domain-containing protein [Nitrososphaerota archaeon]|jgi:hypothetical protein|nr:putative DNA binding domain-containing protein [Nitrososphaerota archaeon]
MANVGPEELKQLIAQGEGTTLDFKLDLREDSLREFSKDLAAFSNADGGDILVGVADNKEIVGVEWDAEKSARVQFEGSRCNPKIQPSISTVNVPKVGAVVVISVPKSGSVHQDSNLRYPLRIGNSTVNMDIALLIAVAKGKGLVVGDQMVGNQVEIHLPTPPLTRNSPARKRPGKLRFLLNYLGDESPVVREEALKELSRYAFRYKTEELTGLEDKIFAMLDDPKATVRVQVLHQVSATWSQLAAKRKKRFERMLEPKLISMAKSDSDSSVRQRAVTLLCELGSESAIEVIVDIMRTEPEATFERLGVTNGFRELAKRQSIMLLEKRLFEELRRQNAPEIQARFQKAIDDFRNATWNEM